MAKREIPEINAGSMADIAFLLLIFFLVTTTMDKDTAYERNIPKKIDMENRPPAPDVEKRNICLIKANKLDQLMVRKELMSEPNDISDRVIEFFRKNEKLTLAETAIAAKTATHAGYDFPLYSQITLAEIDVAVEKALEDYEAADAMDDAMPAIVEFKLNVLTEWENKQSAMRLYNKESGKTKMREIHVQSHIRIEVQKETSYELLARIHSEVREALYELRDDAAKSIFNETYGAIEKRYITNESDSEKKSETREDKAKLDLLKLLYPSRVIEVSPN
jgi:biopolymer transport protein ExbD